MPIATSTAFPPADALSASPSDSSPIPSTMPPGSTFDILPPALQALTTLLASPSIAQTTSETGLNGGINGTVANASVTDSIIGPAVAGTAQHDTSLRDLPDLIATAKQRVQNARAVVARLPDVDRTTTQQEAEIRRVEVRIERLKEAWREIQDAANLAAGHVAHDSEMADQSKAITDSDERNTDIKMDEG